MNLDLTDKNLNLLFLFFASASLTIFIIPFVKKLGSKLKILDFPGFRKQHQNPIVRIGGLAITVDFFLSVLIIKLFLGLDINIINPSYEWILYFSLISYFALGFIDDILNLNPFIRLIIQLCISGLISILGINVENFYIESSQFIININIPIFLSFLFTIFWLTGVTNAINWFDGLDGLAAGVVFIISLTLTLIFLDQNFLFLSLLSISIAGSNLGFLIFNYHPAKLLMGDCGSYFIGFSIAILSLLASKEIYEINEIINYKTNFLIAFSLLILPVTDMFIVILRRLFKGNSPFLGDRNHLHHKLLDLGFNHKTTVNIIYSICLFTCCLSLFLHDEKYFNLLIISFYFMFFFILLNYRKIKKTV